MQPPTLDAASQNRLIRAGLAALGATLLASAAFAADAARTHMAVLVQLCGGAEHPHCAWCYAAAAFAVGGLASLAAAARPARSVIPA